MATYTPSTPVDHIGHKPPAPPATGGGDDGRGGDMAEGNGLRGMRERIEALGGTLERDTRTGTRLSIEFPLTPDKGCQG